MLWPDPAQHPRLAQICDNLTARIAEAARWTGEAEGLKVSLAGARDKLTQMNQITARRNAAISLGMPSFTSAASRTVTTQQPAASPRHLMIIFKFGEDRLDAMWLARLTQWGMLRPSSCRRPRSGGCGTRQGCSVGRCQASGEATMRHGKHQAGQHTVRSSVWLHLILYGSASVLDPLHTLDVSHRIGDAAAPPSPGSTLAVRRREWRRLPPPSGAVSGCG